MDARKNQRGMNRRPNGGPDSDKLLSDIRHTRGCMDNTLNELGQKLQPRHMLDEVIDYFWHREEQTTRKAKDVASRAGHKVVEQVREHPLPSLLIGAGIIWMLSQQRQTSAYYPGAGERMKEKMGTAMEGAKERMKEGAESMKERASEIGAQAREKLGSAWESTKEKTRELQDKTQDRVQEYYDRSTQAIRETAETHPIALGIGCLALGVLAGVMAPRTRIEDESFGDVSDKVREQSKQQAREITEKGKEVVGQATEAVKQEVQHDESKSEAGFQPSAQPTSAGKQSPGPL